MTVLSLQLRTGKICSTFHSMKTLGQMYFTLMTAKIGKIRNFINRLSSIHSCNKRERNGAGKNQGKTITKAHFLYGLNQQVFNNYFIIPITLLSQA